MFYCEIPDGATRVRIELISADATTAAAIVLYDSAGAVVTLGSTQHIFISQITLNTDTGMLLELFDDIATAGTVNTGERLEGGYYAPNGGIATTFPTAKQCKRGSTPKLKASAAGNVRCLGSGYIM